MTFVDGPEPEGGLFVENDVISPEPFDVVVVRDANVFDVGELCPCVSDVFFGENVARADEFFDEFSGAFHRFECHVSVFGREGFEGGLGMQVGFGMEFCESGVIEPLQGLFDAKSLCLRGLE